MDALGETIENVGLAQEIKNGLAKNMQKEPAWPDAAAIRAKQDVLKAMGSVSLYTTSRLARYVMDGWAEATGKSFSSGGGASAARASVAFTSAEENGSSGSDAWDEFTGTAAFETLSKYTALADKLASEPTTHKLFAEARPLGRGAFGAVFLVFKKDTGMAMATKKMVKGIAKKNKMLNDVLIEREVLAKIRSPFCVNLHYSYQDDTCVYLTLSLMPGGDLTFLLKSRHTDAKGKKCDFRPLGDDAVKFYAASMACGLQAIHDAGYVYRDMKPQNVRISDMGLTCNITGGPIKQKSGTCGYWSPETINKEPYTTQPDWWSLGVTLFVLQSDKMPFSGKSDEEKNEATISGAIEYKHGEPEIFQSLISGLCEVDMSKRLGCNGGLHDLQAHPYFVGYNWEALEYGKVDAPIKPNVNDINAPSAKDIAAFVPPKDVTWEAADQAKFADFGYMDVELHGMEAIARMKKRKELEKLVGATAGGAKGKPANETAGTSPTVAYAKSNRESKKGEDFAAAVLPGNGAPAAFAIFDGHSGKDTARICSETVCQRLIEKGPPFEPQVIKDMLWAIDEEIGTTGKKDGATAQMLLVEKVGDKLKGTIAWCGDSSLVLADMEDGKVLFTTGSHTAGPDHQEGGSWQEEKGILEFFGAVRKAVEVNEGIDTIKQDATVAMVEKAIESCKDKIPPDTASFLLPSETLTTLMVKALRRGKIIAETMPDKAECRKSVFVRQRDKEHDANEVWVVSTAEKRSDPGYSDLQMTRSICDWRAADMVLPNPQIHTFEVPADKIYRVCLASDGLWDVCNFERAAEEMKKASSVQAAAKKLLKIPEYQYIEVRGHDMMDDDTTILVIELNPSGVKLAGAGGCCEVM